MDESAVAFRLLGPRAGLLPGAVRAENALNNINTHDLPDGALCFVLSERCLYFLNKESTATQDDFAIILPAAGGPGRWFRDAGDYGGNATGALSGFTLGATGSPPLTALTLSAATSLVGVTLASNVLTYHGPPANVRLTGSYVGVMSVADDLTLELQVNGSGVLDTLVRGATTAFQVTGTRNVFLATGDTVGLAAGAATAGRTLTGSARLTIGGL